MVKNEEKRIQTTLNTFINIIDSLVIYDTGSTDSTLNIIKQFTVQNNIPFRLLTGEFINFATSRNKSLDFADTFQDIDFLLLMDCNDELHGGIELRQFCKTQLKTLETAWLMKQEWYSGTYDTYYNIRLIKPRNNWRYKGVVHEWIQKINDVDVQISRKVPNCKIFQDRTQDDDKSKKRFSKDRELLLKEYEKEPTDSRTVFYLAQTCGCLGLIDEAYKYYSIRSEMENGFYEEVFHSFLRMGDIKSKSEWYEAYINYMKAFEHSCRVEPLICISEYYREKKNWFLSYHFAMMACELDYPHHAILFVDNFKYEYLRYHLLGIVAFYCGKFKEGYEACKKAISVRSLQIDKDNIKFYENILFPEEKVKKLLRRKRRCKRR